MVSDGRIRASDADRDGTAAALREHLAAGRLTTEEFDERLDNAYAAKTLGELDDLMTDLPGTDLEPLPDFSLHRVAGSLPPQEGSGRSIEARQGRFSPAWRAAWGSWLAISILVFAIWLVNGASGGLWFLWVVLPLGAVLLGRWIVGAPARSERRPALPRRNHDIPTAARHGPDRGAGCLRCPLRRRSGRALGPLLWPVVPWRRLAGRPQGGMHGWLGARRFRGRGAGVSPATAAYLGRRGCRGVLPG